MIDSLTGFYDRHFLEQHLVTELSRSQRHGYPLNLLLLDLSNFKEINREYGEAAGNAVLKEFSDRLRRSVRSSDVAFRTGPDEFLILLPESSSARVPHVLARLSGVEADHRGQKIPVRFSAGWTAYQADEPSEQILERLAQELANDKRTGRSEEAVRRAESELRQAQNIEALARVAGKLAHDFNNLLNLIKGYSEMALDLLEQSDPLRECLEQIHQANERANSLTRQLLVFTRKQAAGPELLDLNGLLAGMQPMLERLMGEHISLEVRSSPVLGRVSADRGQIEQLVLNLAVNACDNMTQGGRLIIETADVELDETYAGWHPGSRPGSYVMLALRDTGAGTDAETLAHIFEPFSATRERGKGLLLTAAYGIVKQSGGYIWADSEAGRGTVFRIYLPRAEQAVSNLARLSQQR